MNTLVQKIVDIVASMRMTPMHLLLIANVGAAVALLILSNRGVLPLHLADFIFFSLLFLLIALYRSGFAFALFIGMLPLETVNLAPMELGINLRPYQFLAILLLIAILIRLMMGRVRLPLFAWSRADSCIAAFFVLSGMLIPFLPFPELMAFTLKQFLVLLSFGLLYFLGRVFLKKESDVRIALSFFLSSMLVVLSYAVWQSIRFKLHLDPFEVMSGRPNATFPEADFLGGIVAMILSGMLPFGLAFFFRESYSVPQRAAYAVFQFLLTLVLILTVARSGWLAAGVGMVFGATLFFSQQGVFRMLRHFDGNLFRKVTFAKLFVSAPMVFALLVVIFFHLTAFNIFDRGESVSSGLQKITVSCLSTDTALPQTLHSMDELSLNGCRHILLEEIAEEEMSGRFVMEVYRPDPNINIRKKLYADSWALIMAHPFTGIGWGNVSHFFGTDGRGAGLNASNVFLEIWLGGGLLAFCAFMTFWLAVPILLFRRVLSGIDVKRRVWLMSCLSVWVALSVFNLFNSGLLLGTLWVTLSVFVWIVYEIIPTHS